MGGSRQLHLSVQTPWVHQLGGGRWKPLSNPGNESLDSREKRPGDDLSDTDETERELRLAFSDLFREFQARIVKEQSVLFTLGYSFGDEHVNNIIFQALTSLVRVMM
jgi:hypothetical protein